MIAAGCREELFDSATLYHEATMAGTPAIPLVRMLTARVAGDAQKFVHWGATSQDVIDTALMLQMREGLELLVAGLLGLCNACAHHALDPANYLGSTNVFINRALAAYRENESL